MKAMKHQTDINEIIFAPTEAALERVYDDQLGTRAWHSLDLVDRKKVKSQIWKSGAAIMQENFRDVVENVISGS